MICAEHYFDWAATSPADKDILERALEYSILHWGNPSSIHAAGADARKALEDARELAARSLGVSQSRIYFTSGGTEGDHIPLLSVLARPQKGSVLVSAIEHPAMAEMSKSIKNCGWDLITVNPDKDGFVRPGHITDKLRDDTAFVAVMAVNNETGAVQDIRGISDALKSACGGKRRPHLHVDCVQAAGKIPLDFLEDCADSASMSAHKICGPRGAGILYAAKPFTPFLRGGGQEGGIRSGTESLFGAYSMALCLERYAVTEKNTAASERYERQLEWTERFMAGLRDIKGCAIIPHCRASLSAEDSRRMFSPWVVQAAFPGIPGQVMERALSAEGFYISTGSACSSGSHARPVLDSMHIPPEEREGAVRFSFGPHTTYAAMTELLEKVRSVSERFL